MSKLIVLILSVSVGYANAFPLFDELTGQGLVKQQAAKYRNEAASCASFAGTWKGACKKGNISEEEKTLTLVQEGCQYVGTKDMLVPVGGIAEFGITTPQTDKAAPTVIRATAGLVWNTEKTQLVIDVLAMNKALGSATALESYEGKAVVRIDGDKLLITWAERGQEQKQICEFTKQP